MAKKTSVRITGIAEAKNNAVKFLNNLASDDKILNQLGKESSDQIRKRTQAGIEDYKQKPLTELTIEVRKLMARNNGEGAFYQDKRSNLTLSGQLLAAITYRIDRARAEAIVYLEKARHALFPLSEAERKFLYNAIIDKDHNATNSKRKDPKDAIRLRALFIASQKQENKNNLEIKEELEKMDRKFMFISEKLEALLQSKIVAELRKQLSIYNKIIRK